jgi:uncharacterized protein (DUF952 family)
LPLIYKLLPQSEWQAAKAAGVFKGSGIDLADGYIHFSTGQHAQETARRYFAGQTDLMLLTLEADDLGPKLVWEPSRGGDLFPHLYEPLALDKVLAETRLELDSGGIPRLGDLA